MKTIGIIGGMGWEGSATYYRVMNREIGSKLGGWHSARIILDSLNFHAIAGAQSREDFQFVRSALVASAQRLEQAGAMLVVMACNTVHRFAEAVAASVSIPLLHIADAAGDALNEGGHKRVGLLGTRATMQGKFYRQRLAENHRLDVAVPSASLQSKVNELILNELITGNKPTKCKVTLDTAVDALARDGCTAVLLACTELGLVYGAPDCALVQEALPLYDTAVLHAQAAVRVALQG